MFEQRPLEVLAAHITAMLVGAMLMAGFAAYGQYKAKKATENKNHDTQQ
jgi:hypothetical protein